MITVHGNPHSTCTRKVLTTLEEKGARYDLRVVDLATKQQKSSEHLARQPFGVVPVLDHDGFEMYESRAIVRYLDRALPGVSLTPSDLRDYARMEQFVSIEQSYFSGPSIQLLYQARGGQPDAKIVDENRTKLAHTADVLDRRLGEAKYLGGASFSLGDISFMPYFALLERLGHGDIASSRKNVSRWWAEVSARESWKKVSG
ncbi:glutathione S-transferase family protein [Sandaracinus amylolyticus]|uniref:glutathione S-transferase family protein n=1 Tax=Sandaracinus amylolyticus TaxID=927083 RepID=UPI001F01212F|nr:glutathione S-transferase N-terminal domain-containing protein [Sandaracinus amylolyticus]UJR81690.1 Phi class glutathione S-transferase [Sandaracinus amylolyticus]